MVTNFFLGANSGGGFQSLYDGFTDPEGLRDLMVLKGGPGVGKSTFMKYIGRRAEEAGEDVEYIWCSGDPDSLDGVLLPRLGIAAVDGTAPHVVEPRFPAAADRYVDLGRFYDVDALKTRRGEVEEHTAACSAAYRRAYRAFRAAEEVAEELRAQVLPGWDREKLLKRTDGILRRELRKQGGGTGTCRERFLGGKTCKGALCRYDAALALAPRAYLLLDTWGLGDMMLQRIAEEAAIRGYDAIRCPDPEHPRRLRHLILPEAGLCFLTEEGSFPETPYRRLHLDALLAPQRQSRARIRFGRRMSRALTEEGMEALAQAKASHDLLEAVYHPYVDFDGVEALARREWARIEAQLDR